MSLADATTLPAAETSKKSITGELVAFLIALVLVALWGLSIFAFGVPGLYIPAVAAVPVIYVVLLIITVG